jgi:hypothetical protein
MKDESDKRYMKWLRTMWLFFHKRTTEAEFVEARRAAQSPREFEISQRSTALMMNVLEKLKAGEWTPEEASDWLEAKRIAASSEEDMEAAQDALRMFPIVSETYRAFKEGRTLSDDEFAQIWNRTLEER